MPVSDDEQIVADVVVLGSGMSGITVAATAAERGAAVVVIDTADHIGGSAALSGGYVWTAPTLEVFREQDPQGDVEHFSQLLHEFPDALSWVEGLGVTMGPTVSDILGYGTGRQIDIGHYMKRCKRLIESAGGSVFFETEPVRLLTLENCVVGVEARELRTGDVAQIRASAVVLCTGGFQGNPNLRDKYIYPGASSLLLRSNPESSGSGLRLALEVGASMTPLTGGFYGHLFPYPMDKVDPNEYTLMSQYYSNHALILDRSGRRIVDESWGDHLNNQAVAPLGSSLIFADERVRREQVVIPYLPGLEAVDKMRLASERGSNYATGTTVEEVASSAEQWGYDAEGIVETVRSYNRAMKEGLPVTPTRKLHRRELNEPPFAILEVQATITFGYDGLATDIDGRVLSGDLPIVGLYAAGVDAGGLNAWGYTGGLVRGLALGRRVGSVVYERRA